MNTDTERLEFIVVEGCGAVTVTGSDARGWSVMDQTDGLVFLSRHLPTWREAIDVAIPKFRETELIRELRDFCRDRGLERRSADELLADATDPTDRTYLAGYIERWDANFSKENHDDQTS